MYHFESFAECICMHSILILNFLLFHFDQHIFKVLGRAGLGRPAAPAILYSTQYPHVF